MRALLRSARVLLLCCSSLVCGVCGAVLVRCKVSCLSVVGVGVRAGADLGVVAAGVGATTTAVVVAGTVAAAGVGAAPVAAAAVMRSWWELLGLVRVCRVCQVQRACVRHRASRGPAGCIEIQVGSVAADSVSDDSGFFAVDGSDASSCEGAWCGVSCVSSVDVGTRAGSGHGVVVAGVGARAPVAVGCFLWFRWEVSCLVGRCRACQG